MIPVVELKPIKVFFLTDDKPGHKNQLLGLEKSLSIVASISSTWLSVSKFELSWRDIFLKRFTSQIEKPDIVVAAGSATQKYALALSRKFGAFSVILMRPNIFPYCFFDAVIVPKHDNPPKRNNVLETYGVLNKVRPVKNKSLSGKGLILIGGESKHFHWDDDLVYKQIIEVVNKEKSVKKWFITDSRRTPQTFINLINGLDQSVVMYFPCGQTSSEWLPMQLQDSDKIWVTPDSVSMVYEALTSGNNTGLFDLKPVGKGRISQGIEALRQKRLVCDVYGVDDSARARRAFLCESDRAAEWLVHKFYKR